MELTVKELIEQLQKIQNQDAVIALQANSGNPDDDELDVIYDTLELWEDGEDTITLMLFIEGNLNLK